MTDKIEVKGGWVRIGEAWVDSARVVAVEDCLVSLGPGISPTKGTAVRLDGISDEYQIRDCSASDVLDAINKARRAVALANSLLVLEVSGVVANVVQDELDQTLKDES